MFRPPVSWGGRSVLEYLCCFPRYFPRGFPRQHLDPCDDTHIFRVSEFPSLLQCQCVRRTRLLEGCTGRGNPTTALEDPRRNPVDRTHLHILTIQIKLTFDIPIESSLRSNQHLICELPTKTLLRTSLSRRRPPT